MRKPFQDSEIKVGMSAFTLIDGAWVKVKIEAANRIFCRIGWIYLVRPEAGAPRTWGRRASALFREEPAAKSV